MELNPILSALGRNKIGATLIVLQIALTLAILCNAIYIMGQRLALIGRPSGTDEAYVFTVQNQWIRRIPGRAARVQADLAALRSVPGVVYAYASNAEPLNNGGVVYGITLNPQSPAFLLAPTYWGDENTLKTLGVRLTAGRDFTPSEIRDIKSGAGMRPPGAILVTRHLAEKLAPGGQVLGQVATLVMPGGKANAPIVGIIDRLQAPFVATPQSAGIVEDSMILPYRPIDSAPYYIVRVEPKQLNAAMKATPAALAAVSRERVIGRVRSLAQARRDIYGANRTMVQLLMLVCAVLLAVTAFGIIGLTSYWVSQRRRQIGVRRALGATRGGIMRYFQLENFLLTATGVVIGVGLALYGNLWLVERFSIERMHYGFLLIGTVVMLILGQIAVLWPALRATSVAPAVAARGL